MLAGLLPCEENPKRGRLAQVLAFWHANLVCCGYLLLARPAPETPPPRTLPASHPERHGVILACVSIAAVIAAVNLHTSNSGPEAKGIA